MYYCNDCKQFITPKTKAETFSYEFWGSMETGKRYLEICPECGSEDIEKAGKCGICGLPVKSSEDYCEQCLKLANRYISDLATELEVTTEKAKDLLLAVMEEEK
jgi:predicted amidophosphoribosyltransferase